MISPDFINCCDDSVFYLVVGSLISADTLTSIEYCERSLEIANDLLEAIDKSSIDELKKEKWIKILNDSIPIIKQDCI